MRWIHDRAFPIRNAGGDVHSIAAISEDITERKEADAAIRQTGEDYRRLFESAHDAIVILDPDDETIWAMQETIQALLPQAGYYQYEVSAYAKPGRECQHNLNYWEFGDYLGIGAGAHAKLTHSNGIKRLVKQRQPTAYLETSRSTKSIVSEKYVAPPDAAFEFMLNALRLTRGFPQKLFAERTGFPLATVERVMREAEDKRLLTIDDAFIRPTGLGRRFLNDLTALFLPVEPAA